MTEQQTTAESPGAEFVDANLREARFVRSDLSGAVMRGVEIAGADIDAPWLLEPENALLINGIDVVPFVDAELNRRFPGREDRRAATPEGLRDAWSKLEAAWAHAIARVQSMPEGTADVSVRGEWSFAQSVRHLVMAIDTWLRKAVQQINEPYHPIGQPNHEYVTDGYDPAVFDAGTPKYADVLAVHSARMSMVREFLAAVTDDELAAKRGNPWGPDHQVTVRSCLHTILEEGWEHLRYATRDLDELSSR